MDPRRLIVTDVDGTLTGDDRALAEFTSWLASRREHYLLAYATGRSRASLLRLLGTVGAPEPDAVISSVGTEIHLRDGRPLPGWIERFDGWNAADVHPVISDIPGVRPQPADAQTRLKASFDAVGLRDADLAAVESRLAAEGIAANVVYSAGLHLDVIPAAAGKGIAARELAAAWDIDADRVLVFGDSGNDSGLFREGFLGTIVANALSELLASAGSAAYRSPVPHAGGILDGIRHWSTT